MGFFQKLKNRLKKTQQSVVSSVERLIKHVRKIDEELFEEIEAVLIQADLGVNTAMKIVEDMRKNVDARGITEATELIDLFKEELARIMDGSEKEFQIDANPYVFLVLGINGAGKTTTIGKLAKKYVDEGKKVMMVAGDTFRAAAIEQLEVWSERANCTIMKKEMGSDPASVCYEALEKAKREEYDIVFIDTAGRLHTKKNLMEELKKIARVIQKVIPEAPHETLLVLDATTGQNAIPQIKTFSEAVPITSFILTKLDGTAKGGIMISLYDEFSIPITHIGIGETVEDLQPFHHEDFIKALFDHEELTETEEMEEIAD